MIHSTAIVHPRAEVPGDCVVGPWVILEEGVVLGSGCRIHAHAILRRGTRLGEGVAVHPFAVIGGPPQDLTVSEDLDSGVMIGMQTVVRENVTISRGGREGSRTIIGDHCFLMAGSHVAHDCRVGHRVVLANAVLLAGHVEVGDYGFIGGGCGIHQFCRIGESAMIGGNSSITLDIPPFLMVADRNHVAGLNLVGLKRRGMGGETIRNLKFCFRAVYAEAGNPREKALAALRAGLGRDPQSQSFLEFFAGGKRGIARWNAEHE